MSKKKPIINVSLFEDDLYVDQRGYLFKKINDVVKVVGIVKNQTRYPLTEEIVEKLMEENLMYEM